MLALDPHSTFDVFLAVEATAGAPTCFKFRFPTGRQLGEIDRLTTEADHAATAAAIEALLLEAINGQLYGIARGDSKQGTPPPADPLLVFGLDGELGQDERCILKARALAGEELAALVTRLAAIDATETLAARVTAMLQLLEESLEAGTGATNLVTQGTARELREVLEKVVRLSQVRALGVGKGVKIAAGQLALSDLWDLANGILNKSQMEEVERKKSALRSASAAGRRSVGAAQTPAPASASA